MSFYAFVPLIISVAVLILHVVIMTRLCYKKKMLLIYELEEIYDGSSEMFTAVVTIIRMRRCYSIEWLVYVILSIIFIFLHNSFLQSDFLQRLFYAPAVAVMAYMIFTMINANAHHRMGELRKMINTNAIFEIVISAFYLGAYLAFFLIFPSGF